MDFAGKGNLHDTTAPTPTILLFGVVQEVRSGKRGDHFEDQSSKTT